MTEQEPPGITSTLIVNKWSPGSITEEELTSEVLISLFEEARW